MRSACKSVRIINFVHASLYNKIIARFIYRMLVNLAKVFFFNYFDQKNYKVKEYKVFT